MDASLKSIKDAFQPAYDEIERRKNADNSERIHFEKSDNSTNLKDNKSFAYVMSSLMMAAFSF